jgi:hypothetical protein
MMLFVSCCVAVPRIVAVAAPCSVFSANAAVREFRAHPIVALLGSFATHDRTNPEGSVSCL